MNHESVKLTTYFGERDRVERRFLADALMDSYAAHGLRASVLLRGALGFGLHHHLRTDRLLTLSEDLPVISVAVDTRTRIEAVLPEIRRLTSKGLITLERARTLALPIVPGDLATGGSELKLTIYLGRKHRLDGDAAYVTTVEILHRHGVAGATVLLGVDGTLRGTRQRAAFLHHNPDVPLMIIAVGTASSVEAALHELVAAVGDPLATVERIRVLKRDGEHLAQAHEIPETDPTGLDVWQKLMIYVGEQSRHGDRPLYQELVQRLREAGAAGATSIRGIWGYHGGHAPHGERFLSLRRRVPVVTVVIDAPDRIRSLYAIVDDVTSETGLVTSELVPALRATGNGVRRGGLRMADPRANA